MFKPAEDYTCEELLRSCQEFFGGLYWAWYRAAVKVVGEEKAEEILVELSEVFAESEVEYLQSLWGKEFKTLADITPPLDVVHRMVGYDYAWTMENNFKGYERITRCPIHSATPAEFKGKGPGLLCTVYCKNIGEKAYARLDSTIEVDTRLSAGDACCGFKIERRRSTHEA